MIPIWIESLVFLFCLSASYINHGLRHNTRFIGVATLFLVISSIAAYFTNYEDFQHTAQLVIDIGLLFILGRYAVSLPRSDWYDLFAITILLAMINNLFIKISFDVISVEAYTIALVLNGTLNWLISLFMWFLLIRIAYDGGSKRSNRQLSFDLLHSFFGMGTHKKTSGP